MAVTDPSQIKAPCRLDIAGTVNDGKRLHVNARITAETDWDVSGMAVALRGFRAGQVVNEATELLAPPGARAVLDRGASRDVYLSIPSGEVSDFQVELLWGNDAATVRHRQPPPMLLSVENVLMEEGGKGCMATNGRRCFSLQFDLKNTSIATIEHARIAVRLQPAVAEGNTPLQTEESFDIPALHLSPGATRPIRVVVESAPPAGTLEPVVVVKEASELTVNQDEYSGK